MYNLVQKWSKRLKLSSHPQTGVVEASLYQDWLDKKYWNLISGWSMTWTIELQNNFRFFSWFHQVINCSKPAQIRSAESYTIVSVNCWEKKSKNNCQFLAVMWQRIKIIERVMLLCVDTSQWPDFCYFQILLPLCASNLRCHFTNWTHFINTCLLSIPLNYMSTFFISFLFLLDYFLSFIQVTQLFYQTNEAHIQDRYSITKLLFQYSSGT